MQDLLINPYFDRAVRMLSQSMKAVTEEGESAEQAIIATGPAGIRSTADVDFYTGKQPHPVQKCHLNMAVFDLAWEEQAAKALDAHSRVRAWVKNDRLGLVVPYRKEGMARKYLPDFLVELEDRQRLIIEIKGQLGDALLKKAAAERWCRAVTRDGRFGRWTYYLCFGADEMQQALDLHRVVEQSRSSHV